MSKALPSLDVISGPAVIAGDFNAVAWSAAVAQVSRRAGVRRVGRRVATFALPFGGLPVGIDHVLASGPGRIAPLKRLGSDHVSLWAELAPWEAVD